MYLHHPRGLRQRSNSKIPRHFIKVRFHLVACLPKANMTKNNVNKLYYGPVIGVYLLFSDNHSYARSHSGGRSSGSNLVLSISPKDTLTCRRQGHVYGAWLTVSTTNPMIPLYLRLLCWLRDHQWQKRHTLHFNDGFSFFFKFLLFRGKCLICTLAMSRCYFVFLLLFRSYEQHLFFFFYCTTQHEQLWGTLVIIE